MDDVRSTGARAASDISQKFQQVGQKMVNVGKTLTTRLTAPLAAVGGFALKASADFESLRQSMDILNGSAEEGARNFERLKEFSAGTPFQIQGLAESQNMLQGFGLSADQAFQSISMIGDIAAVTGGDIKGIGIAFGQAAAEGRLMTRDIRQLINQGVPAIKLLADTMGVANSEVLDLASQGEISFEVLQQAFKDATTEGGMFANGMQQQAKTLRGVFSTMKDNVTIALADIGDQMSGVAKSLMKIVTGLAQRFSSLPASVKTTAVAIAGLAAAIGPVTLGLGALVKLLPTLAAGFSLITGPVGATVAAVGALAAAATYVYDNWDAFRERFMRLWVVVKNGVLEAVASMVDGLGSFLSYLPGVGSSIKGLGASIRSMKGEVPKATTEFKGFGETVTSVMDRVANWMSSAKDETAQMAEETTNAGIAAATAADQYARLNREMSKVKPPSVSVSPEETRQAQQGLRASMVEGRTLSEVMSQGLYQVQEAAGAAASAGARVGNALGQALSQAALHGKNLLDVLGNLIKQFASRVLMRGLSLLLSGGFSGVTGIGGVFKKIFGGMFHTGGIVPGSGEKMALVRGGEGIFTPAQMSAMGNMQGGGGADPRAMQRAFEAALGNMLGRLGPEEIYVLSRKGQYSY